jgi:hypothetical protein
VLLERIIKQLVEREKALWPEVTIQLASTGPVQMVAADEEYLAQIMRNLLSNAAKYSGAGSTVEVTLEDGEGEVFIKVRDNGPGLSEDDAERLFGLYYRSASAASTAPGAGIGLFVCRELVAAMGGRIWARSMPEGGSEFGFSIPAYVDELDFADEDTVHVFERQQRPASADGAAMPALGGAPLGSGAAVMATNGTAAPSGDDVLLGDVPSPATGATGPNHGAATA